MLWHNAIHLYHTISCKQNYNRQPFKCTNYGCFVIEPRWKCIQKYICSFQETKNLNEKISIVFGKYTDECTITSFLWVNKFNLSFTSYAVNNKVTEANTLKKKIKWLINMLHLTVT